MAFRAIGSTLFRASSARVARPSASLASRFGSPTAAQNLRIRALAAEAGYLDKTEVTERVLEVVRKFEKVQPEKVNPTAHFVDDLGLDSLDTVELVMAFEDEFVIEIPDADAEKILAVSDAVKYLANNVNAQ